MALSCPSERGKTSPCDRSSCRLAWTRMSSRGLATSRRIRRRQPRVAAGAAFPCPTRVALRSPAPHAGRGCRWPGCSGPPRSRCCPPTRGLCRIAADKWLECQVPPATTNKDMILEKNTSATLNAWRTRSFISLTDICFEMPIRRTLRFTVRIRFDCR